MIINFPESRQVRRAFRNTRNTLPDILNVLVLLIASIALFSLMAVKLFKVIPLMTSQNILHHLISFSIQYIEVNNFDQFVFAFQGQGTFQDRERVLLRQLPRLLLGLVRLGYDVQQPRHHDARVRLPEVVLPLLHHLPHRQPLHVHGRLSRRRL